MIVTVLFIIAVITLVIFIGKYIGNIFIVVSYAIIIRPDEIVPLCSVPMSDLRFL